MKKVRRNKTVENYAFKHYFPLNHCGLCGNSGVIDTRGVTTAGGITVGGIWWCICPNGQAHRQNNPNNPTETELKY